MASARSLRQFCEALHEETGSRSRWTTIVAVARPLDMDVRVAILPAADCAAADLVWLDVKGPPYALLPSSARLTEEGWKSVLKRAAVKAKAASIVRQLVC